VATLSGHADHSLRPCRGSFEFLREKPPGSAARRLGDPHRNVGCEVSMSGITGAFNRALGRELPGRVGEFGQAGQSVVEEFRYRGLH
jgi:hypothetical protein